MATGDIQDFQKRLLHVMPQGWFGENHPVLDGLLYGCADVHSFIYSLISYVTLQTRIKTATEENLDLISCDFFGGRFPRKPGESDTLFRRRLLALILQEKATRRGMINALTILTGNTPIIYEPWWANDNGGYNNPGLYYNISGGYGSGSYAYQCWIIVFVTEVGLQFFGGLNYPTWGYNIADGSANGYFCGESFIEQGLLDSDILAVINNVKVYGTLCHVIIVRS